MNDWAELIECRNCGELQSRENFTLDEDVMYCDDCVRQIDQHAVDKHIEDEQT